MTVITCRVLGPVELIIDGNPAPPELLWRKNLALVVYLARSPKRARSRDHLIGLLWGEKPESAARHSLNEAIRVLRKYAGSEGIESEAGQVRLAADVVELDTDQFERWVADGDWERAVALVAGEFMEGFSVPGCSEFEDWLYAERMSWRELSVDALASRARQLLAAGELREAAAAARRALALDASSAAAAREAMRSLAIAGDRAGALEIYEAHAAHLAEAVGIEPDEDSRALAERIRRERSWRLPEFVARAAAAEGAESRRAPLVGREAELERLVDTWLACRSQGRAMLGMIEGDPGTGKTRMAEELLARARLDGAVASAARAVESDVDEVWSGALALARGLGPETPGLEAAPEAVAALAAQLPGWGERFGSSEGGPAAPLGRAWIELMRAVAEQSPLFLMLDDAQWVDRESLLAIAALLRDLQGAPVFLLVAATSYPDRPELDELRARIGRDLAGVSVRLAPLSAESLRALARWALPSYDPVELDRVTRRVATDSAGLPLLAVELLGAVALGLDLGTTGGAWPAPFRTLDQSLPGDLPDTVVAAVRVSFRRLTRDAQTVLAAAAVLGERVDTNMLRRATGLEAGALAAALDELEWGRWLTAESRGYTFIARVVREVVDRDMLTAGQRRRILEAAGGA